MKRLGKWSTIARLLGHSGLGLMSAGSVVVGMGCSTPQPEVTPEPDPVGEQSDAIQGTNLGGSNLGGTNLGGTNLGGTNLGGANLGGNNLGGTNLGGTNL